MKGLVVIFAFVLPQIALGLDVAVCEIKRTGLITHAFRISLEENTKTMRGLREEGKIGVWILTAHHNKLKKEAGLAVYHISLRDAKAAPRSKLCQKNPQHISCSPPQLPPFNKFAPLAEQPETTEKILFDHNGKRVSAIIEKHVEFDPSKPQEPFSVEISKRADLYGIYTLDCRFK